VAQLGRRPHRSSTGPLSRRLRTIRFSVCRRTASGSRSAPPSSLLPTPSRVADPPRCGSSSRFWRKSAVARQARLLRPTSSVVVANRGFLPYRQAADGDSTIPTASPPRLGRRCWFSSSAESSRTRAHRITTPVPHQECTTHIIPARR